MKKNIFLLARALLIISITSPALAQSTLFENSITGEWADQEAQGTLLNNIIFDGAPVSSTDLIAKSTFGLVIIENEGPARCSGTLIASDIILTAAHCTEKAKPSNIYVEYFSNASQTFKKIKVIENRVFPAYHNDAKSGQALGDLALLHLEKPIPASKPALLPKLDLSIQNNQQILVAGLGKNENNPLDAGGFEKLSNDPAAAPYLVILNSITATNQQKKAAAIEMLAMVQRHPLLSTQSIGSLEFINSNSNKASHMAIRNSDGHSVCGGDSGGPSFLRNNSGPLVVVGVHSTSTNAECKGAAFSIFTRHDVGYDTYVSTYFSWIQKTLRELHSQSI